MTGTEVGNDGAPSDGGSLHRPRRLRPLGAESQGRSQQPSATTGDAPVPAACPWLRLASDPRARAGHVTGDHRCDVKADLVPDPGHQLAYCLSANHVSCPHLHSRDAPAPPVPLPASPIEPIRSRALAATGGPAPQTGGWTGRAGWAALGGLIAVAIAGALAFLYAASAAPLPSPPENAPNADAAATVAPDLLSAALQQLASAQATAEEASDRDVTPSDEAGASDDQQSGGEASQSALATSQSALAASQSAPAGGDPAANPAAAPPAAGVAETPALQSDAPAAVNQFGRVQPRYPVELLRDWPQVVFWQVGYGDSIHDISILYGTTIEAVATYNGLTDASAIYAGQNLAVPVGFHLSLESTAAVAENE